MSTPLPLRLAGSGEDSRGREVLPIGRLGMARRATRGALAMQLRDIERAAGSARPDDSAARPGRRRGRLPRA